MKKIVKSIVTPKWATIKSMYQSETNGSDKYGSNFEVGGELDELCGEFIDMMGEITHRFGYDAVIEDIPMDLWKERIWSLVENAGLLPEIAWRDDKESDRLEAEDKWNKEEDEFDYDFDSMEQNYIDLLANEA